MFNFSSFYMRLLILDLVVLVLMLMLGCEKKKNDGTATGNPVVSSAAKGDVFAHKLSVFAVGNVDLNYLAASGSASTAGSAKLAAQLNGNVELSVLDSSGKEVYYNRFSSSSVAPSFAASETGSYTVLIKNNTSDSLNVSHASATGAKSDSSVELSNNLSTSIYNNITLKGFVSFGRQCRDNLGSTTTTAPTGRYYVQPYIFMGKTSSSTSNGTTQYSVSNIYDSTISITSGDTTINLKPLSASNVQNTGGGIPKAALSMYNEMGGVFANTNNWSTDPVQFNMVLNFVRGFYNAFFGAAGELYTTETFHLNGSCANAQTIALDSDPGKTSISLKIVNSNLSTPIDLSIPIQASIEPAYNVKAADGQSFSDWTQCSTNRANGDPVPYNGSGSCKNLSLATPPYLELTYLPSKDPSKTGITSASDPTRLIFFGYGTTGSFYKQLVQNNTAFNNKTMTSLSINNCLNNGGMLSVPLQSSGTNPIPISELNSQVGDVITLDKRSGKYTALTQFFQGNVTKNESIALNACVPDGTNSCNTSPVNITVNVSGCSYKADSGIAVGAINTNSVYPGWSALSGIIVQ